MSAITLPVHSVHTYMRPDSFPLICRVACLRGRGPEYFRGVGKSSFVDARRFFFILLWRLVTCGVPLTRPSADHTFPANCHHQWWRKELSIHASAKITRAPAKVNGLFMFKNRKRPNGNPVLCSMEAGADGWVTLTLIRLSRAWPPSRCSSRPRLLSVY